MTLPGIDWRRGEGHVVAHVVRVVHVAAAVRPVLLGPDNKIMVTIYPSQDDDIYIFAPDHRPLEGVGPVGALIPSPAHGAVLLLGGGVHVVTVVLQLEVPVVGEVSVGLLVCRLLACK